MYESMMKVITGYGLISGFAVIGLTMWVLSALLVRHVWAGL